MPLFKIGLFLISLIKEDYTLKTCSCLLRSSVDEFFHTDSLNIYLIYGIIFLVLFDLLAICQHSTAFSPRSLANSRMCFAKVIRIVKNQDIRLVFYYYALDWSLISKPFVVETTHQH